MNKVLKGYLQLCRPPNLPTAAADVLAGLAIGGIVTAEPSLWNALPVFSLEIFLLVIASICLYAGGVVMNDVFDIAIDKSERPERPIPSGLIPLKNARFLGLFFLFFGILIAVIVGFYTGLVALVLAAAILMYDKYAKHHAFFGPLNMGVCRGLNLLLGLAYLQSWEQWPYCLVPIVFVFAITMISQGEVHGKNKRNILLAGLLYVFVIFYVSSMSQSTAMTFVFQISFLTLFAVMVLLPLVYAYRTNTPVMIKRAVKAGVISIVVLDAAMAVAHSSLLYALCILMLLPLSILLAKLFAVT